MIVDTQLVILWIVLEPLGAKHGRFEPVRELQQPRLARGGRNGLVVSDTEKHREIAKRRDLVRDEIRPGGAEIARDEHRLRRQTQFRRRDHVFVERVDGAEVAQMPVELRAAVANARSDGGHHDVAAVSGIARDREFPGCRGGILCER